MKHSDIAAIATIALISVVVAYFIANAIFGNIQTNGVPVKVISPISSNVDTPNPAIFNSDAINPTTAVNISSDSGSQ